MGWTVGHRVSLIPFQVFIHYLAQPTKHTFSDIDQHVAQLDFDDHLHSSSINGQSSLFASIMLDPSVISTDSMDMDTFRMRCENNKNDYKLTNFEDSGQWTTTSGIGASVTTGPNTNNSTANNTPPSHLSTAKRDMILKRLKLAEGQGIFGGQNSHFGLALLEQLNNLDLESELDSPRALMDNLLNHNHNQPMTTWGRIIQTGDNPTQLQPCFEEKTYSLPELNLSPQDKGETGATGASSLTHHLSANGQRRPFSSNAALFLPAPPTPISPNFSTLSSTSSSKRPPSLLANFVEQQQLFHKLNRENTGVAQQQPVDYDYSEVYLGEGRYVDLNENEIGYVPPSTAPIQKDRWRLHQNQEARRETANASAFPPFVAVVAGGPGSRPRSYAQATLTVPATPPAGLRKHQRTFGTFADLSPSQTAPDLKFLSMSHKVPSLCRSSVSFDDMLKKAKEGAYLTDCCLEDEKMLFDGAQAGSSSASSSHQISALNNGPDSGLGNSSNSSGPLHIEDWSSLSVLLPRHVVDACSFFKTNTSLLTGSDASSPSNNIESKKKKKVLRTSSSNTDPTSGFDGVSACRTCFSVRRRNCLHPPNWAQSAEKRLLCDCSGVEGNCSCVAANFRCPNGCDTLPSHQLASSSSSNRRPGLSKLKLHAEELSIVGLPIYEAKRNLVERVVDGVAEIARGASSVVLLNALERLFADGLLHGHKPWDVIVQVTRPGPATNNIFQLVKRLEASEKSENSRVDNFFQEVLKMAELCGAEGECVGEIVRRHSFLVARFDSLSIFAMAFGGERGVAVRLVPVPTPQLPPVHLAAKLGQVVGKCLQTAGRLSSSKGLIESPMKLNLIKRIIKSSSMPARLTSDLPMVVVEDVREEAEKGVEEKPARRPSLLEKAVGNRASVGLSKEESSVVVNRPSTSAATTPTLSPTNSSAASSKSCATHSRIPTMVGSPCSSTQFLGNRPRSRSTFSNQQPSTINMLSPSTSTTRSRSLLRLKQKKGENSSRIPVRVFGGSPMTNVY